MPFHAAHGITGRAVALAEQRAVRLYGLRLDVMQAIDPRIDRRGFDVLSVDAWVASRTSFGGTAPSNVRAAIRAAREETR